MNNRLPQQQMYSQQPPPAQMSNMIFLSEPNFRLVQGKKGALLGIDMKGYNLVFFYTDECKICSQFKPQYFATAQRMGKMRFSLVNLSKNRRIIDMSKQTIMPLTKVPHIVFYNDGRPVATYTGTHNVESLIGFITNIIQHVNSTSQQQNREQKQQTSNNNDSDEGIPFNVVCDDEGMCYLTNDEVYEGKSCEDGQCCYITDAEL
jgi:thiol-disulfide isomerase/thioredoxin